MNSNRGFSLFVVILILAIIGGAGAYWYLELSPEAKLRSAVEESREKQKAVDDAMYPVEPAQPGGASDTSKGSQTLPQNPTMTGKWNGGMALVTVAGTASTDSVAVLAVRNPIDGNETDTSFGAVYNRSWQHMLVPVAGGKFSGAFNLTTSSYLLYIYDYETKKLLETRSLDLTITDPS